MTDIQELISNGYKADWLRRRPRGIHLSKGTNFLLLEDTTGTSHLLAETGGFLAGIILWLMLN